MELPEPFLWEDYMNTVVCDECGESMDVVVIDIHLRTSPGCAV